MANLDCGHALSFKTIIEPFRIHSTQRIPFPTRQERLEAIQRAGTQTSIFLNCETSAKLEFTRLAVRWP